MCSKYGMRVSPRGSTAREKIISHVSLRVCQVPSVNGCTSATFSILSIEHREVKSEGCSNFVSALESHVGLDKLGNLDLERTFNSG